MPSFQPSVRPTPLFTQPESSLKSFPGMKTGHLGTGIYLAGVWPAPDPVRQGHTGNSLSQDPIAHPIGFASRRYTLATRKSRSSWRRMGVLNEANRRQGRDRTQFYLSCGKSGKVLVSYLLIQIVRSSPSPISRLIRMVGHAGSKSIFSAHSTIKTPSPSQSSQPRSKMSSRFSSR